MIGLNDDMAKYIGNLKIPGDEGCSIDAPFDEETLYERPFCAWVGGTCGSDGKYCPGCIFEDDDDNV